MNGLNDWLEQQKDNIISLTEDLVNIDSNSYDSDGVVQVFKCLEAFFAEHGLTVTWHRHNGVQNAISVEIPGRVRSNKPVLLLGHCDTVHPTGEASIRPFTIKEGRAYGPGVADMKAGVAMNAFIVAGFYKFGGAPGPLYALFTNDEEIGSPSSRTVIEYFAKKSSYVINAEPGRPDWGAVTQRKGGVFLKIETTGKAAHSGANFPEGISAINEVTEKIIRLSALTDLEKGITVNVGLVSGGLSVNTVAPQASCSVDLRINTQQDRELLVNQIKEIVKESFVAGTSSSIEIIGEFSPMNRSSKSKQLFELYRTLAAKQGYDVKEHFSGGCADSGITSSLGCATICAAGPVGGKPHTKEEYVEIDSFVPRAQLAAKVINQLN